MIGHGWRAAAASSPGAGTHTQLAVSRQSIQGTEDRPSFFAAVPNSCRALGPDESSRTRLRKTQEGAKAELTQDQGPP